MVLKLAAACPERPRSIRLVDRRYETSKRVFDLFGSLVLGALTLPLLLACAAMLWISQGRPIVFSQLRTGYGGQRFRIYKFRTMVVDAAARRDQYAELNQLSGPDFKIEFDPRVTTFGRFLRKSSLDELPQIWNVLRGDMSLVGPRPTSFEASEYLLWHTERLEVMPGLTGLWQVSGRSDVDFDDRVRLDVAYIENRSFRLDLRILLETPIALLKQRGAY